MAGRIRYDLVLLEAVAEILGVALEADPNALADVVRNRRSIKLETGDHFDLPLLFQNAPLCAWTHKGWDIAERARRKTKAVRRSLEASRVGNGCGFYGGLGAVKESVEHLGIQAATCGLFCGHTPVIPDGFRRRLAVLRQPFFF